MMVEKAPGKYTAEFTPHENTELQIMWRLASETKTVNGTMMKWKVIPVPTHREVSIWHKGIIEADPEWDDEVTLKFKIASGRIVYVDGDAPTFKTSS